MALATVTALTSAGIPAAGIVGVTVELIVPAVRALVDTGSIEPLADGNG